MRGVYFVGLGVMAGCMAEPAVTVAAAPVTGDCDVFRCGSNSPFIDGRGFHELNLYGAENTEHLRLVGFTQAGTSYQLQVTRGRLWGINASGTISGPGLAGASLVIADNLGARFTIRIQSVGSVAYWAGLPGITPHARLETYNLQWAPFGIGQFQPVCGNPVQGELTLGMTGLTAVVFEGDRIDAWAKTVSPAIDPAWFNIGCAGHALAKLALTGHTEAARADGYDTTTDERQAMLKMIVADYCGDGTAFTIAGQPLAWQDERHWMTMTVPVGTLDARWTAAGASCLSMPRLRAHPPVPLPPEFLPSVLQAIRRVCPLTPCADPDPHAQGGAHVISANPL